MHASAETTVSASGFDKRKESVTLEIENRNALSPQQKSHRVIRATTTMYTGAILCPAPGLQTFIKNCSWLQRARNVEDTLFEVKEQS
jgi:hypothetical protein